MKPPVIGISAGKIDSPSMLAMRNRLEEISATTQIIYDHANRDVAGDFAAIDGLIIMGNDFDIDPENYIHRYPEGSPKRVIHPNTKNEKHCPKATARALYETQLITLALQHKLPMLCICGGMQRLNVICGGTLHQHVADEIQETESFRNNQGFAGDVPIVPVVIEAGTNLSILARKVQMSFIKTTIPGIPTVIMENSFRHQSIDGVGDGLRVCAISDTIPTKNGAKRYLIEAIEPTPNGPYGDQFLMGVQWHPEFNASGIGRELVRILHERAQKFKNQRA